jgi:hypothetical protein
MRVHLANRIPTLLLMAAAGLTAACDQHTTDPGIANVQPKPAAIVVTPGLSVYTDRTSWEAAVVAAGATVQNMDFTGLTTGRVTQLVTDYGAFKILVDHVSANQFSNPGIDLFADAGCSLGVGDCDVFHFNMIDPTVVADAPKLNQLIFPQNIIAFGGDFLQVGRTVPPPGSATGTITLRIGSETVAVNSYMDGSGNGFFGFVATANDTISWTFAKSGSLQNDIFDIYNPAYANAPAVGPGVPQKIANLQALIGGLNLPSGVGTALDAKLRTALFYLNANNTAGACASLQSLINQASAQSGKKIGTANANQIKSDAAAIMDDLGC